MFQAQFGFYDTVVAARSQAAALRAWGTRQNLFAEGQARLATNEAAVAAALEHPEKPLRRAVGSSEPFALQPTSLPKLPDATRKQKAKRQAKSERSPQPPADRSRVNEAETALREIDERRKQEQADISRDEEALA